MTFGNTPCNRVTSTFAKSCDWFELEKRPAIYRVADSPNLRKGMIKAARKEGGDSAPDKIWLLS